MASSQRSALGIGAGQGMGKATALCLGPVDTPMRWAASPEMDRDLVISPESVAETVALLVNLPRGTMAGEILLQSELYD